MTHPQPAPRPTTPSPEKQSGIPGVFIVLGTLSFVLLVVLIIIGALAFGGLGSSDAPPEDDANLSLTYSDFSAKPPVQTGETTSLEVTVTVKHTGNSAIEHAEIIVQCSDGGYVSVIQSIGPLSPGESKTLVLTLNGSGTPQCADPAISFDSDD